MIKNMNVAGHAVLVVLLLVAIGASQAQAATPRTIIGWVQKATIFPGGLTLRARIDSGANEASVNAQDIQDIRRNGRLWVRFTIADANGRHITLERPEIGRIKIKRHGEGPQTRPVVALRLCLGGIVKQTPVNLADRSDYNYALLIGRRFLAHDFLIDPGATFLPVPRCAPEAR